MAHMHTTSLDLLKSWCRSFFLAILEPKWSFLAAVLFFLAKRLAVRWRHFAGIWCRSCPLHTTSLDLFKICCGSFFGQATAKNGPKWPFWAWLCHQTSANCTWPFSLKMTLGNAYVHALAKFENKQHIGSKVLKVQLKYQKNATAQAIGARGSSIVTRGWNRGPTVPGTNGPNEKHGEWRMHQATKPQLGPTTQIFMLSRA